MLQCPECKTRFDAPEENEGSQEVVCPACMNSFAPSPVENALPPVNLPEENGHKDGSHYEVYTETRRYDIQSSEGGILTGLSRFAIREAIYTGKLTNTARLRKLDGSWEPVGNLTEFAAVFHLLGLEPLPGPATRKIAGWKGERISEGTENPAVKPTPSTSPALTVSLPPPRPFESPSPSGISPALLIGGALLVALVLVGGVLLMIF